MANQNYLRAMDTISGQEGRAVANIGGNVVDLFFLKKLEAKVAKKKAEVKVIGYRGTQHKAVGWSGSGTMSIYHVTSEFRQLMMEYVKNGRDISFTVTVTNDDPSTSVGKQTSVLYNVNLDEIVVALLDVDSDALEEEIPFTFDGVDLLDVFGKPIV